MRLGELIDLLEKSTPVMLVVFDYGKPPGRFASWRGVYQELTLTPGKESVRVRELLAKAKKADGGVFNGWKGGEFTMSRDTPVWADDYGDFDHRGIIGSKVSRSKGLVLLTADLSDYRGW
ncbi:MAG TPA: hypothetical protein VHB02_06185 [Acidimicrobiales bacterium]|nr:hypothetical protein [Acidimicrobiales bacterium]